jgi:hypothetical protein
MTFPTDLNPTRLCSCGNPKPLNTQWCHTCWDALPKSSALRYVQKIHSLRAQLRNSQALINKHLPSHSNHNVTT